MLNGIGSYTFAKTLEYKAKQNLKSGKEVTVIPPNEYQVRFVNAMDGYFLACPGGLEPTPRSYVASDNSSRQVVESTARQARLQRSQCAPECTLRI